MDEYPIIDLSHLLPAAQGLARLPADERIQRLRADRWIGYPRAVEALNRLEALYAWPNKQRMPNLLLVGPTNNGKSMIVEKFRRTHPASSDADQEHIPVLVVQMPSEPSVIRFYVALLAAMGAPLRPRPRLPEMEQLALALLRKVGVRMLVIDELHNVLAGNSVNRREFLNLLRFLGNELRIPLVGVGTRDAYLAIRSDDQLENRFEPMMLPVWEANDDCCSLLASFAASLPLRRPSPNCHAGHGSLPAHTQRGHHRGTGALADGGGHRRRGERRGSDQPSHTQHGLSTTSRATKTSRSDCK
ncbi:TniB [Pseudomonas aeruginosa]|nr:TniB [Pseudomonas aeruginosa]